MNCEQMKAITGKLYEKIKEKKEVTRVLSKMR